MIGTIVIIGNILKYPGISPKRRIAAIILDISAISLMLSAGGEQTAFMYGLFLWLIFGNGFRFGVNYLWIATAASVAGFLSVIIANPFWNANLSLSIGLFLALIVLPGYASVLIRKLSVALNEAEEANRAKSLFLASVSHELRTPLNSIIGLSDLLESGEKLSTEQSEMVQTIGQSGRTLLNLIKSVLDLSRMEAGKMPAIYEFLDVLSLVQKIHAIMRIQAEKKQIELRLFISPGIPQQVKACTMHIEEVLMNLLSNAIKFTESGYVQLNVTLASRQDSRCRIIFSVQDTGIGIAPDAQQRIFESFSQADYSILHRFGGTGLGLSIARKMVEADGGQLTVTSAPGEGSTFTFDLEFECVNGTIFDGSGLSGSVIALSDDFHVRYELDQVFSSIKFSKSADEIQTHVS